VSDRAVAGAAVDVDVRGQSVDADALDGGVFPYEAWEFAVSDTDPVLTLRSPWTLSAKLFATFRGSAINADYGVTDDDLVLWLGVTTGSVSDVTVTLPPVATNQGRVLFIVKVDNGTEAVIVAGNGVETIRGDASVTLASQWDCITVLSIGTVWVVLLEVIA